eukprot:2494233-Amphidinium_carterae.1
MGNLAVAIGVHLLPSRQYVRTLETTDLSFKRNKSVEVPLCHCAAVQEESCKQQAVQHCNISLALHSTQRVSGCVAAIRNAPKRSNLDCSRRFTYFSTHAPKHTTRTGESTIQRIASAGIDNCNWSTIQFPCRTEPTDSNLNASPRCTVTMLQACLSQFASCTHPSQHKHDMHQNAECSFICSEALASSKYGKRHHLLLYLQLALLSKTCEDWQLWQHNSLVKIAISPLVHPLPSMHRVGGETGHRQTHARTHARTHKLKALS